MKAHGLGRRAERLVNDAGASGFLVKPLEADQILPLIRTTLEGER